LNTYAKSKAAYARWEAHPWTPVASKEVLVEMYVTKGMTQKEIAQALGCSPKPVETAMKKFNIPRRSTAKRDQRGQKNHAWKGADAGYQALHLRIYSVKGRPGRCVECGTTEKCEWANKTGNYHDVEDFQSMCRSCHRIYDNARSKAA